MGRKRRTRMVRRFSTNFTRPTESWQENLFLQLRWKTTLKRHHIPLNHHFLSINGTATVPIEGGLSSTPLLAARVADDVERLHLDVTNTCEIAVRVVQGVDRFVASAGAGVIALMLKNGKRRA
jgi:hypothetical protein